MREARRAQGRRAGPAAGSPQWLGLRAHSELVAHRPGFPQGKGGDPAVICQQRPDSPTPLRGGGCFPHFRKVDVRLTKEPRGVPLSRQTKRDRPHRKEDENREQREWFPFLFVTSDNSVSSHRDSVNSGRSLWMTVKHFERYQGKSIRRGGVRTCRMPQVQTCTSSLLLKYPFTKHLGITLSICFTYSRRKCIAYS